MWCVASSGGSHKISFPSCISQPKYIGVPDWFENPPLIKGKFHVYGEGELRMEAILFALVSLEESIKTSVIKESGQFDYSSNSIGSGQAISKLTNGLFSIEGKSENFFKETGEGIDSEIYQTFELIQNLLYN